VHAADSEQRRQDAYVQSAYEREMNALLAAKPGDRNNALNRAAFALGQLVGADLLPRGQVEADLLQVAGRIELGHAEACATITSGLESGIQDPRQLPPPSPDFVNRIEVNLPGDFGGEFVCGEGPREEARVNPEDNGHAEANGRVQPARPQPPPKSGR
jgi:hypothetical protein